MKLHDVVFEGKTVNMPFLSAEDCREYKDLLAQKLASVEVEKMEFGICNEVAYVLTPEGAVRGVLDLLMDKVFGTMPIEGGGRYCYLPDYVGAQTRPSAGIVHAGKGRNSEGSFNYRVRRFWIAYQLAILREGKTC